MLRIAMLLKTMSSTMAPSAVSSAKPLQLSKTQFDMVMLRNPPFDSVPHLMRPVARPANDERHRLPRSIQYRADLVVAGDETIRNGEIFGAARVSQCERTLWADRVIVGRVHGAIGDAHIAAAVNVHAVAIGIDSQVIDSQVIDAGCKNAEPSALKNLKIAECDVAAELQCDRLVANAGLRCVGQIGVTVVAATETFAPDTTRPEDGHVVEVLAPQETIVPVIVTIVLIGLPRTLRLGRIVAAAGCPLERHGGGQQRCTLIEVDSDIALEVNRVAGIRACGKQNRAPAGLLRRIDRALDGLCIQRLAISGRAVTANVEEGFRRSAGIRRAGGRQHRNAGEGRTRSSPLQDVPAIEQRIIGSIHVSCGGDNNPQASSLSFRRAST